MSARHRRSFLVFLLLVGAVGCAGSGGDGEAVDYQAEELRTGEPVDLADLAGDPVLLTSWATWCEPCQEELPAIEAFYQDRLDDGLQVVAVNVNAIGPDEPAIEPMADGLGLTMPLWRDPDNRFAVAFDGVGVPTNVLVDADGAILRTWAGAIDVTDPEVVDAVDDALDAA